MQERHELAFVTTNEVAPFSHGIECLISKDLEPIFEWLIIWNFIDNLALINHRKAYLSKDLLLGQISHNRM